MGTRTSLNLAESDLNAASAIIFAFFINNQKHFLALALPLK